MPKILLNMIVKDEEDNIAPLYESVKDVIAGYAVVDTGSTDNTRRAFQQLPIPGAYAERDFVGFATSRNQALDLFHGWGKENGFTHALIMDADDTLTGDISMVKRINDFNSFAIPKRLQTIQWATPNLINHGPWTWLYPIHEVLWTATEKAFVLPDVFVECNTRKGIRSKTPDRFREDVELLKKMIVDYGQDNNALARAYFYLAQTYTTLGECDNAIATYEKRISLGGYQEECCVSHLMIAQHLSLLGEPTEKIVKHLVHAHECSPDRAEPLAMLSNVFHALARSKVFSPAFLFADRSYYGNHISAAEQGLS